MKPKNIWILNHYAVPPGMAGGTRHYSLARILVQHGYQVTILASNWHRFSKQRTPLEKGAQWAKEEIDGVQFVWLRTPPYTENDWRRVVNWLSYMVRAIVQGRKLSRVSAEIGKPDVIIGSSVHLLAVVAAYYLARHYRAHFVMEVRDLWPQTLVDMGALGERNPLTWLLRQLERFLYVRAEKIISLLPYAHEYICSMGISPEKVVWIPNGVDLSLWQGVAPVASESKGSGFTVMYAGAHGAANALDTLVRAASIVQGLGRRDIRFVLIGEGPEKPRLQALAKRLQLENIEFRDHLPKAQIPAVLMAADACAYTLQNLPLFAYGVSSNKLFDYLAAARPILFAVNARNNVVEEANCGLSLPPADPQALAEGIIKLANMPLEEREAMGRRGREYVEQNHDFAVLAGKLEALIESLETK